MRWVGYVAHMAEEEHRVLAGKSEEKRQMGIPRHRWEDTKIDFREIGRGGMDLIHLVRDRQSSGNEPSGSIKRWKFLEWLSNCWLLKTDSDPWS
jgi:hypothetical protein